MPPSGILGGRCSGSAMTARTRRPWPTLQAKVETEVPGPAAALPLIGTALDTRRAGHPRDGRTEAGVPAAGGGTGHGPIPGCHPRASVPLVVEDAHHMDEASQGILQDLARQLTDRPGLLC